MNVDFLESDNQNCLDLTATNVSIRDLVPPAQTSIENISSCDRATFQSLTVPALSNPTFGPTLNVTTQNLTVNNVRAQTLQADVLTIDQVTTSNAVINKIIHGDADRSSRAAAAGFLGSPQFVSDVLLR